MLPCLLLGGFLHHSKAWVMAIGVALSLIHVSISVANIFVHSSTAADQGYHAFGELARFVYCLLQKIKKASSLPPLDQWEEYVVSNHSKFPAIDEKEFSPVLVWWLRWEKLVANTYRQNFVVMPVAFSKSLWIVPCQPWLLDPSLDRAWAASALQLWLVGMTSLLSNFLTSS